MLKTLKITGFRCFDNLLVEPLERINLIVGNNNAGKTCVLEALDLLLRANPSAIQEAANRRSELVFVPFFNNTLQGLADVRLFFYGRSAIPGAQFQIEGASERDNIGTLGQIEALVQPTNVPNSMMVGPQNGVFPGPTLQEPSSVVFNLVFSSGVIKNNTRLAIGKEGGLLPFVGIPISNVPVHYIPTGATNGILAAQYWGSIVARPEEDRVLEVLRILEPKLERIAIAPNPTPGVFVRLQGINDRVPIGNLGDGILHMLVLASQLVVSAGGVLLIDEIDTGLHVSAMARMWEVIMTTAKLLDVQVFATTHSDDCLRGLAQVIKRGGGRDKRDCLTSS